MIKIICLMFLFSCFDKSSNIKSVNIKAVDTESKGSFDEKELVDFESQQFDMHSFNQLYQILLSGKMIKNVNYKDRQDQTPLILSISVFMLNIRDKEVTDKAIMVIQQLLKSETIDVNIKNKDGNTALSILSKLNSEESGKLVDLLLEKDNIEVNELNIEGFSPLILSIKNRGTEIFERLVNYEKTNINMPSKHNISPLYYALIVGDSDERESKVTLLLGRQEINVNRKDTCYSPFLHNIITNKDKKVALSNLKLLLSHPQIDINIMDSEKTKPLSYALKYDAPSEVIDLLLDKEGIDIDAYVKYGEQQNSSALIEVVRKGMISAVRKIADKIKKLDRRHIITFKYLSKTALEYATTEKNKYIDEKGEITNKEKYDIYSAIEKIVLDLESFNFERKMSTISGYELMNILQRVIKDGNYEELEQKLKTRNLSPSSYKVAMMFLKQKREMASENDLMLKIKQILKTNNSDNESEE